MKKQLSIIVLLFGFWGTACDDLEDSCEGCGNEGDSHDNWDNQNSEDNEIDGEEQLVALCNGTMSHSEFEQLLEGNLVVAAKHVEKGVAAGQLVQQLAIGLVLNGIDFSNPKYDIAFENGKYEVTNGEAFIGFRLYYADPSDPELYDTVIEHNIFDLDNYLVDLEIGEIDIFDGTFEYSFEKGPLFELIAGDISFDFDGITEIAVNFPFAAPKVAIEFQSQKTYIGLPPRIDDELTVQMTTTRIPLEQLHELYYEGGVGFSYTGTSYDSVYYDIDQVFTDSLFMMREDKPDQWYWEGEYQSTVNKKNQTFYQQGYVSSLEQNYTEYYCDAAQTQKLGVAWHRLDLTGGEFEFVDGTRFPYGLGPF